MGCCRDGGCDDFDLDVLQGEIAEWARFNFGELLPHHQFLGVVEEVGELAHAILKREQKIRGTPQEHQEAEEDAVGDISIFLMNYCTSRNMSLKQLIYRVWNSVKDRNFRLYPKNGLTE